MTPSWCHGAELGSPAHHRGGSTSEQEAEQVLAALPALIKPSPSSLPPTTAPVPA